MTLLQLVIHVADVSLYFVLGQTWLWKTPRGEALIRGLEGGVGHWVQRRASTPVMSDVRSLNGFLAWSGLLALVLAVVLVRAGAITAAVSLRSIAAIAFVGWLALDWTFEHRSFRRALTSPLTVVVLLLSCIATALIARPLLDAQLRYLLDHLLGIRSPTETVLYSAISALLLFALVASYAVGWAVFGGLALLILFAVYLGSRLSRISVKYVNRDLAWLLVFLVAVALRFVKPFL